MTTTSKYKGLLLAALLTTIFTSCKKDFLDLDSPTTITPEAALGTETDLQAALRGTYAGMRSANNQGRTIPVFGDLFADNAYVSVSNSNRYVYGGNFNWTVANSDMANFWNTSYNIITRANNIIHSTIASNPNVDQIKGEAYAIRALNYFNLVRYFARPYTDNPAGLGVPVVTDYNPLLSDYNIALKPARSTVTQVYTLINDDLAKAYTMMTKLTNSSQFSKYAAKALQAKVYLTMNDKTNAKAAALDVINNSGYTLVGAAEYKAYWENPVIQTYTTAASPKVETIFEISSDATNNAGFDGLAYIYHQTGYGDLLASTDLYNLYSATDVRKTLYTTGTRGGLASIFVNKYPGTGGDRSDTKILRLSEMYLIAAEASLPGNEADALTYVNAITTRRSATPVASTGATLFEDIITERRKELAFEGDRYLDLQRLKRDINRSANYPAAAKSILYSNFRRVLPIPLTETDANPVIRPQQNPGY